jgi:hypothetical protein
LSAGTSGWPANFEIRNTKGTEELGGMDFADDAAAVAFGNDVIQDLTSRAAKQYDGCLMEISEGERHLPPHARLSDMRLTLGQRFCTLWY